MEAFTGPVYEPAFDIDALKAIEERHSVRRYHERALGEKELLTLRAAVDSANRTADLHIQLICNEPRAFKGVLAYGKFSGVTNYLVMAGRKAADLDERIGYMGEQLVLIAQSLGLNTCWAGLTYKKIPNTYTLADGEKIACYIALGYGLTQGVAHKGKTIGQVSNAGANAPEWFVRGVEAALKAPTAVNQQKFRFELLEGNRVKAVRLTSLVGYTRMDLGIARLHFELGAGKCFQWAE